MWMIFHVFVIYLMFSSLSIKLFLETRNRNPTWTCFQKEELTEKNVMMGVRKGTREEYDWDRLKE